MTSTTSTHNDKRKTVLFNVGGIKYEVARSTIEMFPDTMLAKLISKTWQQEKNADSEGIFIDRDGFIFRHVLAYMRDTRVLLPASIPKASVLQELEYFGFEEVDSNAIDFSIPSTIAAAAMATAQFRARHKAEVKGFEDRISECNRSIEAEVKSLKSKIAISKLAFECFLQSCRGSEVNVGVGIIRVFPSEETKKTFEKTFGGYSHNLGPQDKLFLDNCLAQYGLCSNQTRIYSYFDCKVMANDSGSNSSGSGS